MTLTTADGSVAGFLSRSRLDFREARPAGRSPRGERHEFRHRGSTADACRRRPFEEILPWEHIHLGVKKEYLWREWQRALELDRETRDQPGWK